MARSHRSAQWGSDPVDDRVRRPLTHLIQLPPELAEAPRAGAKLPARSARFNGLGARQ
jgi:hypothetical protein